MIYDIVVPISVMAVALLHAAFRAEVLQFGCLPDHLDEFSTPQPEVDMLIVFEHIWVVDIGVLESFLDVSF